MLSIEQDKEDYNFQATVCCSPTRRLRTSSVSMAALSSYDSQSKHHHHHSSQDALSRSHLTHTTPYYSHTQLNNLSLNNNSSSVGGSSSKHNTNGSCHQRNHANNQHCSSSNYHHYPSPQQHNRSSHSSPPTKKSSSSSALAFSSSSPQLCVHKSQSMTNATASNVATAPAYDDQSPPPIPPLPLNYQRSDGLLQLPILIIFFYYYYILYLK